MGYLSRPIAPAIPLPHSSTIMPNRFLILLIPLGLVIFSQPLVADGFLPGIVNKTLNLLVLVGAFLIFKGNRKLLAVIIGLFFIAAIAIPLDRTTPGPTPLIVGVVAQITAMAMTMASPPRSPSFAGTNSPVALPSTG